MKQTVSRWARNGVSLVLLARLAIACAQSSDDAKSDDAGVGAHDAGGVKYDASIHDGGGGGGAVDDTSAYDAGNSANPSDDAGQTNSDDAGQSSFDGAPGFDASPLLQCTANTDCPGFVPGADGGVKPGTNFCMTLGTCSGTGICASLIDCEPDAGAVCGCDGVTYPSGCEARLAGVSLASLWACGDTGGGGDR